MKFAAEASRLHPAWPSAPAPCAGDQPPAEVSASAKGAGKAPAPAAAAERNSSKLAAPAAAGKGSKLQQTSPKGRRPALGPPAKSVHEVRMLLLFTAVECTLQKAIAGKSMAQSTDVRNAGTAILGGYLQFPCNNLRPHHKRSWTRDRASCANAVGPLCRR